MKSTVQHCPLTLKSYLILISLSESFEVELENETFLRVDTLKAVQEDMTVTLTFRKKIWIQRNRKKKFGEIQRMSLNSTIFMN